MFDPEVPGRKIMLRIAEAEMLNGGCVSRVVITVAILSRVSALATCAAADSDVSAIWIEFFAPLGGAQ